MRKIIAVRPAFRIWGHRIFTQHTGNAARCRYFPHTTNAIAIRIANRTDRFFPMLMLVMVLMFIVQFMSAMVVMVRWFRILWRFHHRSTSITSAPRTTRRFTVPFTATGFYVALSMLMELLFRRMHVIAHRQTVVAGAWTGFGHYAAGRRRIIDLSFGAWNIRMIRRICRVTTQRMVMVVMMMMRMRMSVATI